ncbi:MAG: Dispase autolysis-inducing protein precursor [Chloroflexi bacterium ADurb.Bin180]|nr:MAG: Dispase autolysis-inducing protein precursor [Chloroflexi bacterium ADurb.Bin180]
MEYDGRWLGQGHILVQLFRRLGGQCVTSTLWTTASGDYAFGGLTEGDFYLRVWLNPTEHPGEPLPYDLVAWYDTNGDGQPDTLAVPRGGQGNAGTIALHDPPSATVRGTIHYSGRQSNQHWLTVRAMGGPEGRQMLAETSCLACGGAYTLPVMANSFSVHAWLDANDNGVVDWPDPTGYYDPDKLGYPAGITPAKSREPGASVSGCDFGLSDPPPPDRSWVNPVWGPTVEGGQVMALAARNDVSGTLFAINGMSNADGGVGLGYTAYSHVLRSTDGGATWRTVFTSLWDLRGLAVQGDEVIAVGAGGWNMDLVAVSHDGGLYWTVTFTSTWMAPGWYGLRTVAIDPVSPLTVLAAGWQANNSMDCYSGLILRSDDGGASWTQVLKTAQTCSGAGESEFRALAIDPTQHTTVLAAGAVVLEDRSVGVIYRSDDGGTNWTRISSSTEVAAFTTLQFDPLTPTLLYAGAEARDGQSGRRRERRFYDGWDEGLLWCSRDGGRNWERCYDRAGLYASAGSGGQLYAATAVSVHRARSSASVEWEKAGSLPSSAGAIRALLADPSIPGRVYAGTDREGVYVSDDFGVTWRRSSAGMRTVVVPQQMAVDPGDNARFFVAGGALGGFATTDDGATWSQIGTGAGWYAVAIDPSDRQRALAGLIGHPSASLLRSEDDGSSWIPVSVTLTAGYRNSPPGIRTIAFSPSSPRVVYAGGQDRVEWQDHAALLRSADGGRTFTQLAGPAGSYRVQCLAVQPSDDSVLVAAADWTTPAGDRVGALWYSSDRGLTWERTFSPGSFRTVAFDPAHPQVVYAAGGPVVKSTDGGRTWAILREGRVAGGDVALDPLRPEWVYNVGLKVFDLSTDGGASWARYGFSGFQWNDMEVMPGRLTVTNLNGVQRLYLGGPGVFVGERPAP